MTTNKNVMGCLCALHFLPTKDGNNGLYKISFSDSLIDRD